MKTSKKAVCPTNHPIEMYTPAPLDWQPNGLANARPVALKKKSLQNEREDGLVLHRLFSLSIWPSAITPQKEKDRKNPCQTTYLKSRGGPGLVAAVPGCAALCSLRASVHNVQLERATSPLKMIIAKTVFPPKSSKVGFPKKNSPPGGPGSLARFFSGLWKKAGGNQRLL